MSGSPRLKTTVAMFLKLGVLGFGGPAAHIAMMRDEVVTRRRWMTDGEFLRIAGATNLIPGPNSTELAMHIGSTRHGWRGLVATGAAFILPATTITAVFAWLYSVHGTDPRVSDLRFGLAPMIIAIVTHAAIVLGRASIDSAGSAALVTVAATAFLVGVHEVVILAVCGAAAASAATIRRWRLRSPAVLVAAALTNPSLARIATSFLEIGATLYGSGYVLLAYLESRFVDSDYLSPDQLLDAIAVGQITPGPVFSSATFIGWQLAGPAGAAVATVAIFAPAFVFVAMLGPLAARLEQHDIGRKVLDGVVAASLGMMIAVLVPLGNVVFADPVTIAVAAMALVGLATRRLSTTTLVVIGVVIGVVRIL